MKAIFQVAWTCLQKTVYEVNLGSNLVLKDQPYAYEGHNLIGIAYDENGEDRYRPYMPVNTSMDVYDGWFYSAKYAGYFYGGANMPLFYFNADGTGLAFEDTGFIDTDLTWWSDGSHLVVEGESTGQLFGRLTNQGSEVIQLDFLQTVCNFVHLGTPPLLKNLATISLVAEKPSSSEEDRDMSRPPRANRRSPMKKEATADTF